MKTIEIVNMYDALVDFLNTKNLPTLFAYKAARNLAIAKPYAEAFRKAVNVENSSYFIEFNKVRREKLENLCKKDSRGNPLADTNGEYVFDNDEIKNTILLELKAEFPNHDEKIAEHNKYIKELADTEEEVPFLKIKIESFPNEIPGNVMAHLLPMIEE